MNPTRSDWRVPKVGDVFEDNFGQRFTVDRVEHLPAEQGYAVGWWDERVFRDTLRFATLNGGTFRRVNPS